ncbi:hypothetical protein C7449_107267 [Mycoplana dimorpha]|uniref:Uncharacterized protein n=1 Tax=Mycoplana dimorpha TaxID=28320 RepID=A0A2T5B1J2_MYCDI|nr:hypothetical protein C7449_107267 [Mycoplana dimorpha]
MGAKLTHFPISDSPKRMGRPPLNVKATVVRLPASVPDRIDALVGKQKRAKFIRDAVLRELELREREAGLIASEDEAASTKPADAATKD